jgi:hypothetical protein
MDQFGLYGPAYGRPYVLSSRTGIVHKRQDADFVLILEIGKRLRFLSGRRPTHKNKRQHKVQRLEANLPILPSAGLFHNVPPSRMHNFLPNNSSLVPLGCFWKGFVPPSSFLILFTRSITLSLLPLVITLRFLLQGERAA